MSAVSLMQPILDGGVQRNNFFNGRLLSAEDLRAEQDANRVQRGHLAHAIGDGVAWGLDVSIASATELTVTVRKGLALNRHLDLLALADHTTIMLVPEKPSAIAVGEDAFKECDPPRESAAYTGAGAYVLVAAPASGYLGTALVSDPNTTAAGRGVCGARFSVEGVRFRLVPMALTRFTGMRSASIKRIVQLLPPPDAAARERLRNLLAHLCFGAQQLGDYFTDPLAPNGKETTWSGWGAVDEMRELGDLTDCDVPLALVMLTRSGIGFVDTWAVRRRIVGAGGTATWRGVAGPRRLSETEAGFLQFQAQLEGVKTLEAAQTIAADRYFDVLPPAGWLPAGKGGFDWQRFLGAHAPPAVTPIDSALLRGIIERSWLDEPFSLATSPPVPLHVYEVPGESFVVFARSALGNVRIEFTPAPGAAELVDVQLAATTGISVHGSALSENRLTISDVVPGVHAVTITAPDYLPVLASEVVVVGGRTTDIRVALSPQPNGSILVDAVDKATDDRLAASKVLSITATGGGSTFSAVVRNGRWLLEHLPEGTYSITGTASGYNSAVLAAVGPTKKGTVLDAVLRFEPSVHAAPQPPKCITLSKSEQRVFSEMRICMILKATEFQEKYFYERGERRGEGAIANDRFRLASRRLAVAERGSRYATSSGEIVYSEKEPWARMMAIKELPDNVQHWLREWRDWIADDLSVEAIKKSDPRIYVDQSFRLSKAAVEVPDLPAAYAVFGHLAVPLTIAADDSLTKLPMALDRDVLPWVMRETFASLREAGITHLNDLAGAWSELVVDATGDPPDTAPYLIFDAARSARQVNDVRGYYPGVTPQLDAALKQQGFPTDLSIANATPERLMKLVGNRGFAVRLIYEARQIVPKSSWSLEALPLTKFQVADLFIFGIESQGALLEHSTRPAGKQLIARALGVGGLSVAKKEEVINPLVNEAANVLSRIAVALAPNVTLSRWGGVDPTTAAKLTANGITSVDELARADEGAVAIAGNLSSAAAKVLVGNAQAESLTEASVAAVLGLTSNQGTKLTEAFGAEKPTLGGMLGKSAVDLSGAFGDETRAGSVLNGIKQGLKDRGIG